MATNSTLLPQPDAVASHGRPGYPGSLVVLAEGGPSIGAGHVLRSLALASAWTRSGGEVHVIASGDDDLDERVRGTGLPVMSATEAATVESAWLLADGYGLGDEQTRAWRSRGARVIGVDDHARTGRHHVDVVVDQNLDGPRDAYRRAAPGARLCLGPRYALLAPIDRYPPRPPAPRPLRLVVAAGGAPPPEFADFVRAVLRTARWPVPIEIDIIGNLGVDAGQDVRNHGMVDAVGPYLARADIALTPTGSTVWDLCRHGVAMVGVPLFDNQRPVADALDAQGLADVVEAGDVQAAVAHLTQLAGDDGERRRRSRQGRQLVDGRGADRVVNVVRADSITLRPVEEGDRQRLYRWVNDPDVRAASFDRSEIDWEGHVEWFDRRLADEGTAIYVADDPEPWGQVRFDIEDRRSVIGVSIAAPWRGRGLAAPLLAAATERFFADHPEVSEVVAEIRVANTRSQGAFAVAGFIEERVVRDGEGVEYVRHREASR